MNLLRDWWISAEAMGITIFEPDTSNTLMRVTPVVFREAVDVAYNKHVHLHDWWTIDQMLLHTTTHELGHAVHLEHTDADEVVDSESVMSIMTEGGTLYPDETLLWLGTYDTVKWEYRWGVRSLEHFHNHELHRWAPNKSLTFGERWFGWSGFFNLGPSCH